MIQKRTALRRILNGFAASALLCMFPNPVLADEATDLVKNAMPLVCEGPLNRAPLSGARMLDRKQFRTRQGQGRRVRWQAPGNRFVEVTRLRERGRQLTFFDLYDADNRQEPRVRGVADGRCRVLGGRRIVYASKNEIMAIEHLAPDFRQVVRTIALNPPVPEGKSKDCLAIGILDNGVNYLQPRIAERLKRTGSGTLVGTDVWENDALPFDYGVPPGPRDDPRLSAFSPNHHGTMVAHVVLDYAPSTACLVPVRYPPFDRGDAVHRAVDFFRKSGVKIVSVQSGRSQPWPQFEQAITNNPQILFVIAAGNEGRDLSQNPRYPAVYDQPNVLVVGGVDSRGQLWRGSNFGKPFTDVAVEAVEVPVTRFDGKQARLSGTSFAAPKVAGYAATLLARSPDMSGEDLHQAIISAARAGGQAVSDMPILSESLLKR